MLVSVKEYAADVLTTAPFSVQLLNRYPALADAVTVCTDPIVKLPPQQTLPPAAGEALTLIVKVESTVWVSDEDVLAAKFGAPE